MLSVFPSGQRTLKFGLGLGAQAEVDAEIALRDVVAAAADFVDLRPAARRQTRAARRWHRVPRRSSPDQDGIAVLPEVLEQRRRLRAC